MSQYGNYKRSIVGDILTIINAKIALLAVLSGLGKTYEQRAKLYNLRTLAFSELNKDDPDMGIIDGYIKEMEVVVNNMRAIA